ncbi:MULTISPECIES: hypothetical protein [unclassified Streptomyces]|uniref:hypothetical protein n=1 Tax=unclassified Streptomyces TaxID=2593676 RepID=UPI0036E43B9B
MYSGLLAVSVREGEPFVNADWTSSAAEVLRPYGAAAVDGGAEFLNDVTHTLTWVLAIAPLPLAVVSLLWLARRAQQAYLRLAIALMLSGTAGLGVLAVGRGWPVHETSLFGDYLALPGATAGWYVLMALAVVTTTAQTWPRVTVLLTALAATAAGASTGGSLWLAVLPPVVVPLLAWLAAGHLLHEKQQYARGRANASPAGGVPGRVLSFRARTRTPQRAHAPEASPLRQAG